MTRAEFGSLYPVWRNGIPDSRWSGCLVTLVRRLESSEFVDARLLLPQPLHMSHNAAMVCVNGTLHVFGGQYSEVMRGEERLFRGVMHTSLRSPEEPFSTPHLVFDRANLLATRCVERRTQRRGLCEFDGKLSVVYWRNGCFQTMLALSPPAWPMPWRRSSATQMVTRSPWPHMLAVRPK